MAVYGHRWPESRTNVGSQADAPVQAKAGVLAHAEVLHADLATADGEFAIFQNMARADVQRVAKKYFTTGSRVVMHVRPKNGGSRP